MGRRRLIKDVHMKNFLKILLIAFTFGFYSCGKSDSDASKYLTMDIGNAAGILIPAPATTQSCDEMSKGTADKGSVAGAYFTLPNPVFRWTEQDPSLSEVRVIILKLSLKSPKLGGEYNCTFSDTALGTLYYKKVAVPGSTESTEIRIWNGLLGKAGSAGFTSSDVLSKEQGFTACNIKCGGLSVPPNSGQFGVSGTWEVVAVQKKFKAADSTAYEEFPIKIQGSFSVDNVLNN